MSEPHRDQPATGGPARDESVTGEPTPGEPAHTGRPGTGRSGTDQADTDQAWGRGHTRPVIVEKRPPALVRLGGWWLVALALICGIAWAATDHLLRATLTIGGACVLGAVLRLLLPPGRAGGLVVRSRATDVIVLLVFAGAVLAAGFALDLRARV